MHKQRLWGWLPDLVIWVPGTLALATCALLEYLAGYKAGIMRYLYYRKIEHLEGVYCSECMMYHTGFALLLLVSGVIWWRMRSVPRRSLIALFIFCALVLWALCSVMLQDLFIYNYLLFTLEIIMVVCAVRVLWAGLSAKKA